MAKAAIEKLPRAGDTPPLYLQVKDHAVQQILSGHWPQGSQLPSENELTAQLGVSRMTVHRALRELTAEGWLVRVRGAGTYVAEAKPHSALLEIRDIRAEVLERGHEHVCEVVALRSERASAEVADSLELPLGAAVYHALLLHRESGKPIQLEDRLVNPDFAPGYLRQDFTKVTSYQYLSALGPMDAAEHLVEAVLPSRSVARLLEISETQPCLLVQRRTWSNGMVVNRVRFTHPGNRYRLAGHQAFDPPLWDASWEGVSAKEEKA